jgi:hypothetical protein
MHEHLIADLERRFPSPPIYHRARMVCPEEWILERGIEAGRAEVIHYLKALWGVIDTPLDPQDTNVRTPENRPAADEYGRSAPAPYPEPSSDGP